MKTSRIARIGARVVLVATVSVLAAACSGPVQDAAPEVVSSGEVPAFDGPYAEDFARLYTTATSDFVREALADEEVTDAEYAEMTARLTSCLADQGVTLKSIAPGEGMTTSVASDGSDTNAIVDRCSTESGEDSLGALRDFMVTNPDNVDVAASMVDCLAASGTVPADYSAEDYTADSAGRFAEPSALEPQLLEAYMACSEDPMGMLADE